MTYKSWVCSARDSALPPELPPFLFFVMAEPQGPVQFIDKFLRRPKPIFWSDGHSPL